MEFSESKIADYYKNKSLFITGSTGFIGKLLIKKLLSTCPDIRNIYCVIREKNGNTAEQRLNEIISCKIFDSLRKKYPLFKEKLIAIGGQILDKDLNISHENLSILMEDVHIVYHLAGTVKFDEDLRTSLLTNVLGLRNAIELSTKFPKLESFVYISSIYANCDRCDIDEIIYPCNVPAQKILNILEWMSDDMLRIAAKKLLGNKPNNFTFTKWVAETLLHEEAGNLPVVIVRPSTIGASWKEPFAGWVEKSSEPCDLFIAAGRGYLRTMKSEGHAVLDIVPVDIVVNLLITSAWYTGMNKKRETTIYHCTTGGLHPFRWGEIENFFTSYSKSIPFEGAFRRPNLTLTSNTLVHDYLVFFSHLIPAYMADAGLALIGQKPRVVNVYRKIHKMLGSIEYLTERDWKCTYENLIQLRNSLIESDSQMFNFDPRLIHWPTYIENYLLGTKKYLLNEDLHGIPAAKQHLRNLKAIRWCTNTIIAVILWRLLIAKSQLASNLWFLILNMAARFIRFARINASLIKQ